MSKGVRSNRKPTEKVKRAICNKSLRKTGSFRDIKCRDIIFVGRDLKIETFGSKVKEPAVNGKSINWLKVITGVAMFIGNVVVWIMHQSI